MGYENTNLSFLRNDLIRLYGESRGEELFKAAEKKYGELCAGKKETENRELNNHIFGKIFAAMGLYFALQEQGFSKEEAFDATLKETQHNARNMKAENSKLAKMPFSYGLFKTFAKAHMTKNYPAEGWDIEWKRRDGQEVHFDMTRCIYKDTCDEYGCPELCTVFCQNDTTAFEGYLPKIKF